jgi:hypothetical protein
MKKIILSLFILAALTSFTTAEWITFTSKEGKFTVLLPNEPETKEEEGGVAGTASGFSTTLYLSIDNKTMYIVGYVDYDPSNEIDTKVELDANRDNFVNAVGGKLLESKEVNFLGHKGILFTALTENNNYLYTSYVFIVGRRPYQLVIGSPEGKPSPDEKKFFNSFKLSN